MNSMEQSHKIFVPITSKNTPSIYEFKKDVLAPVCVSNICVNLRKPGSDKSIVKIIQRWSVCILLSAS